MIKDDHLPGINGEKLNPLQVKNTHTQQHQDAGNGHCTDSRFLLQQNTTEHHHHSQYSRNY